MTPEQQAAARAIAENEQIIERLRLQNEMLRTLLPRVRREDPGFITHPITGERAIYVGQKNPKKPARRGRAGGGVAAYAAGGR